MGYGFRIFAVQAFKNKVTDNEPSDVSNGGEVYEHVLACLEEVDGQTFFKKRREPAEPDPLMPRKPRRSISFRLYEQLDGGWVHAQVSIGREGDHDRATAEGSDPLAIQDRSAESRRFITLIFPPDGDRFLLVSEAVGASDAHELVLGELTQASMRIRDRQHRASQAARAAAREEGVRPLPRVVRGDRYIFRARQLVDGEYLDALMHDASELNAVFTLHEPSPRGGESTFTRKRLVVRMEDDTERAESSKASIGWIKSRRKGKPSTHREAIAQLDGILSLDEGETEGYDEVSLQIRTADDRSVTVTPLDAREVFTYPLSGSRCSVVHYYDRVADRAIKVATLNDIEVTQIDAKGAARCLPTISDSPAAGSTLGDSSEQ